MNFDDKTNMPPEGDIEQTRPFLRPSPDGPQMNMKSDMDGFRTPDLPGSVYQNSPAPNPPIPEPNYYSASRQGDAPEPRDNPPKERGRGVRVPGIIALCLTCSILGGIAGGALTSAYRAGNDDSSLSSPPPVIQTANSEGREPASSINNKDLKTGNEIYTLACPQTVGISSSISRNIFGQETKGSVSGSGFIISEDGYIITNYHVIEDAYKSGSEIEVMLYNGESYIADIVGYEEENDIAVLKIEAAGLSAVTLGDSDDMLVGEDVYAVGNPLGELSYTMTSGMISALDREIATSASQTINMFQFDAAVNSGNSGGPLYNSRGEVIGIVTAKYSSTGVEGLGFGIPINGAVDIVNEIITYGYVTGKASFGITVTTVSSNIAQSYNMVEGAYVYSVEPFSCAENAGIQVGDIITDLGGYEIKSSSDLQIAKKKFSAGETTTVTVFRSGQSIELEVTFDESAPRE